MPGKRTPEQQAEHMRGYRAKKKAELETDTPIVIDTPKEAETAMSAIRRERTGDRLANPYTDGLPDWGDLIQGVSQKQRDIWLDRINTHSRRERE